MPFELPFFAAFLHGTGMLYLVQTGQLWAMAFRAHAISPQIMTPAQNNAYMKALGVIIIVVGIVSMLRSRSP